MAHLATRKYTYAAQAGILTAFIGAGLVIGGLASFVPLMGKMDFFGLKDMSAGELMKKLLVPENANALRWSQFISTLFIFFLPPVMYAWLCHKQTFAHLGFKKEAELKQLGLIVLIMLASLPLVSMLQEATEMLPWSKATLLKFKNAEDDYNKQVAVMARMDSFWDYIISVVVIALLPAVFEETLFRGGIQNLLSRWTKKPVLSIILVSIIFSAIHGSYLGFLSRFALSFVLGWMFYRTGNIWLNIIAHFINNAMAVTALYIYSKPGQKIDPSKIDDHFPFLLGLAGLAAVIGLFVFFETINKKYIKHPGEEELLPEYDFGNNPFANDIAAKEEHTQP
jgi:uncharacterized protein